MWPDWVSNPGPLTYESGALPTALRGLPGIEERDLQQIDRILLSAIQSWELW